MSIGGERRQRVDLTKQLLTVGTKGSNNSTSLIFCSILNVAPRIYSLGCCYRTCGTRSAAGFRYRRGVTYEVVSNGVAIRRNPQHVSFVEKWITCNAALYVPDQNHLLFQLSLFIQFGADSIVRKSAYTSKQHDQN